MPGKDPVNYTVGFGLSNQRLIGDWMSLDCWVFLTLLASGQ